MSTVYIVPLLPTPQTFEITLGTTTYNLTVKWNTVSICWVLDIADTANTTIVSGIPLVTGADLLAQYGYLNFGGKLIVQTDNAPNAVPTYANLGADSKLYFVVS